MFKGCKLGLLEYKLESEKKVGKLRDRLFFPLLRFTSWLGGYRIGVESSFTYQEQIELPDDFDLEKYFPNCPFEVTVFKDCSDKEELL